MKKHALSQLGPIVLIVIVVAMLAIPVGTAAAAPEHEGVTATTTTNLRLRSGPGTTQPLLTVVPSGASVVVVGRNPAANWLFVDYSGVQGWVAAWYTIISGDLNSVPITDASGGWQSAAPATGVTVTILSNLRVRSGPGTGHRTIGLAAGGTTAPVLARNSNSTWLLIDYRGARGWVYVGYVSVTGDLNAVPQPGGGGLPAQAPSPAAQQPAPAAPPPPPPPPPPSSSGEVGDMLRLINQARCQRGIPPVVENGLLNNAALAHANDMVNGNFFSHTDPNGRSVVDHFRDVGYNFTALAENLAAGRGSVGETFNQWWNSGDHQANMLNAGMVEAGLAHVYQQGTTYGHYWVLELGNRSGASAPSCAALGF